MAGATTLGDLASAIGIRSQEEAAIVAELKAGSEAAYAWLIGEFQQPVYGLVYRIVNDPADAADTTQDVFLKVFRGMKHFHGGSSLKTWIYRIALHEAANRRPWWFRHKAKATSIEPAELQCPKAKRLVSPYLDGAVTGTEMLALQDHISGCMDCNAVFFEWYGDH